MSNLDLETLVGRGAGLRGSVPANAGSPFRPLRSDAVITQAYNVTQATLDRIGGIVRPGLRKGGFGQADGDNVLIEGIPCALGWEKAQTEAGAIGVGVQNETLGELVVPINTDITTKDRFAIPGWFNEWKKNRPYAIGPMNGERCISTKLDGGTGYYYEVVQEGQSGTIEPIWPLQIQKTVQDGTVVWRCMGAVIFLEVLGDSEGLSHPTQKTVRVKLITG